MSFSPPPMFIPKTPEEIERELERNPGGQVTPFKPNPAQFARYQIRQDGNEVGWVYVRGDGPTRCTEIWLLYTSEATGDGYTMRGEPTVSRAGYTWPSYQRAGAENVDVTLRILYVDAVTEVKVPDPSFVEGRHYTQITSACT